jgi:thiamine pyrophosphate-dependent acetolactate synthase large subunit-like protein
VLINNSAMGNYEKQQPIAQERYNIKHLSGDYVGVARALGAYAERVEQPSEIAPALKKAIDKVAGGQPALLEVITKQEAAVIRLP